MEMFGGKSAELNFVGPEDYLVQVHKHYIGNRTYGILVHGAQEVKLWTVTEITRPLCLLIIHHTTSPQRFNRSRFFMS